jgi:hypothetical protein
VADGSETPDLAETDAPGLGFDQKKAREREREKTKLDGEVETESRGPERGVCGREVAQEFWRGIPEFGGERGKREMAGTFLTSRGHSGVTRIWHGDGGATSLQWHRELKQRRQARARVR